MTAEPISQYSEICRIAIKSSSAKLFFDKCLSIPNQKLIGHTIKDSLADCGKQCSHYLKFNYCCNETIEIAP